jgi:hypothetical protein
MQWCFKKLLYKLLEEIMIFEWKSLDSHRELPTNKSVGVLRDKCMLFGGVLFVQDTVAMLPLFQATVHGLRIKGSTHRLPDFLEWSEWK